MAESDDKGATRGDQPPSDRGATPTEERDEKKDKVLHTRIPPSLDREIKRRARNLGMSVSTVVRNVLLHTFDLVEDIVNDSANLALSIAGDEAERGEARRDRRHATKDAAVAAREEILGWHEVILNLNAVCARCNALLPRGTRAAIGIRDSPGEPTILCTGCLPDLSAADDDDVSA